MGLHYLAAQLGMTVSELCERMTVAEFASWEAYFTQQAEARKQAEQSAGQPVIELGALDAKTLGALF